MSMKPIEILDLTKFCLAVMIVSLHTELFVGSPFCSLVWPWVRIAVPLFFVVSAYLFFLRYDGRWSSVWHACKRILQLYFFWTIFLIVPIICLRRSAFQSEGWLDFGLYFLGCILRGATFQGGWFLIALLLAFCLTCALIKLSRSAWVVWLVAIILFALSTAKSSGCLGLVNVDFVRKFGDGYACIFGGQPFLGFPLALIYVMIGRSFALVTRENGRPNFRYSHLTDALCALLVFWCEWHWLKMKTGVFNYDSYLSLPLVAAAIFSCLIAVDMHFPAARFLRDASIVIFVTHGVSGPFFGMLWERLLHLPPCYAIPRFVVSLAVGMLTTVVIRRLRSRHGFGFLKYAC